MNVDTQEEMKKLREKAVIPFSGSEFLRFQLQSTRIIATCFDLQRAHGFSDEKTVAGMALALSEALDGQENTLIGMINRSSPPTIMLCAECPRKEAVLSSLNAASNPKTVLDATKMVIPGSEPGMTVELVSTIIILVLWRLIVRLQRFNGMAGRDHK